MSVRKIITLPNPILRQKSKTVDPKDPKIRQLVKDLIDTLTASKEPRGVGLAAVQIGKLARVIVVADAQKKIIPMINPQIAKWSKKKPWSPSKKRKPLEGCFSVPGIWGVVLRDPEITVSYQTLRKENISKKFKNFPAVVIQHEIDHCDGILFIDRVREQKGQLYRLAKDKDGKEILIATNEGNL